MADDNELNMLRGMSAPTPGADAKARALKAAMAAYQASNAENISRATQGTKGRLRLTDKAIRLWSGMMQKKLYATPAFATLLALPIAGYTAYHLVQEGTLSFGGGNEIATGPAGGELTRSQTDAEVSTPEVPTPTQTALDKK
jgi:Ca-activated chloride channel family protein